MKDNPYISAPAKSFWSRSVARNFREEELFSCNTPLIAASDIVISAGSCFASNIIPYLENSGLQYLRTEAPHPAFAHLKENFGYHSFSAAYGNIYTARQLLQLLRRATGSFTPVETCWHENGRVVDPFRPGLRFPAKSDREFDLLTNQHLKKALEAFSRANAMVFTLGLTEAWECAADGATLPACPGTIAGTFDGSKYRFVNYSVDQVTSDLKQFLDEVRIVNPGLRLILTVSPVPLVATATGEHVLIATAHSKAVLRVAAHEVCQSREEAFYFPAYEIITGAHQPVDYFMPDRRTVTAAGVEIVMAAFLSHCEVRVDERKKPQLNEAYCLSSKLASAECEEAMLDIEGN
jgi:hypothetical protein